MILLLGNASGWKFWLYFLFQIQYSTFDEYLMMTNYHIKTFHLNFPLNQLNNYLRANISSLGYTYLNSKILNVLWKHHLKSQPEDETSSAEARSQINFDIKKKSEKTASVFNFNRFCYLLLNKHSNKRYILCKTPRGDGHLRSPQWLLKLFKLQNNMSNWSFNIMTWLPNTMFAFA